MSSANQQNNSLIRSVVNVALLTSVVAGFAVACVSSNDNNNDEGGTGGAGTIATGGDSAVGGGASTGGAATTAGGSSSTGNDCPKDNGTYTETTTFATAGGTNPIAPYNLNPFGFDTSAASVSQTTEGPAGLDCSSGCGVMTLTYTPGLLQYKAGGQFVEYFGTATDSIQNLLNETITLELAVQVIPSGTALPVTVTLTGQDTFATTTYVDNNWSFDLGNLTSLDASKGWHTKTYKVTDTHVPTWAPTRWVCASGMHDVAIAILNNADITDATAATIKLYVKSVSISPSP